MSLFLIHTAPCVPDAGITELPVTTRPGPISIELENLLQYRDYDTETDECRRCYRKKRKVEFEAYPTLPSQEPSRRQPRPKRRGCKRLFAFVKHIVCICQSRTKYNLLTRYRYSKQKKPYSSISVYVEQLTSETYEEDDVSGVPELLEAVKLQGAGPTEAARAIRKKLKYGNVHRQLRALTILDGLLQNGGQRLQRTILSDAPLAERLRIAAVDPVSDPDVRNKCKDLFGQWVASSKENPGLEGAKSLYNQLPKKNKTQEQRRQQSKAVRETEQDAFRDDDEEDFRTRQTPASTGETSANWQQRRSSYTPIQPVSNPNVTAASSFGAKKVKKDKKNKAKAFNLEKEKPNILRAIAASSVASTNLNNAIKLVNREKHRVSDDTDARTRFEVCKNLRREILRYIQLIESDELLGGLIHANDELVAALIAFEILDKSVDDDSDSELEEAQHRSRQAARTEDSSTKDAEKMVAGLHLGPGTGTPPKQPPRPNAPGKMAIPPRPTPTAMMMGLKNDKAKKIESESDDSDTEVEDDDDPFGDKNAMKTPDPEAHRRAYGFKIKEV